MKVFSIIIFKKIKENIDIQKEAYNLSDVPFFYRNKTKDLLKFLSKTVAERIQNLKSCITEKDYLIYTLNINNLITITITDKEYPQRIAFSMLDKISQDMENINLEKIIEKYQNPNEADQMLKIQNEIESTKIIMIDAIDKVLERGEKIDDLVVKSSELSEESKTFYKDAKKMNSWCGSCIIQ
jgi:synaptobrevin family protein YKT6